MSTEFFSPPEHSIRAFRRKCGPKRWQSRIANYKYAISYGIWPQNVGCCVLRQGEKNAPPQPYANSIFPVSASIDFTMASDSTW